MVSDGHSRNCSWKSTTTSCRFEHMCYFYVLAIVFTSCMMCRMDAEGSVVETKKLVGRPFVPGMSGNPGGMPKGLAEVRAMAQERSVRAVERLGELVEVGNGRVAIAACIAIYEIAYGKLGSHKGGGGSSDPSSSSRIDLSRLSGDELRQFRALAMKAKAGEQT